MRSKTKHENIAAHPHICASEHLKQGVIMLKARYDVCVIGGAGHVGLPLSIAFANKGKRVIIYDINEKAIEDINSGKMPFLEENAEPILRKVIGKKLFTTNSPEAIISSKFVVVIIGTPVDEHLNPRFHDMKVFFEQIMPYLRNGQIVILRSTLFPGITGKLNVFLKKAHPKLEVVFCPERILEGKAMEELYGLPQIISGFNKKAVAETKKLFSALTAEMIEVPPLEAELAKLFTNSWRYVQFAIANQFFMIAQEYGADFFKIYNAMTKNYPRTKNFPKPGFAAGPCLFKDTMQISAFTNNRFFLGHSAMLVNEGLPDFIIEQLKKKFDLSVKKIGILGMAFKAESDDKRESLSYKLKKIAEVEAKEVYCSDEYIKEAGFLPAEELIRRSDIVIIGAPHKRYKTLKFGKKVLVDVWNHIKFTKI